MSHLLVSMVNDGNCRAAAARLHDSEYENLIEKKKCIHSAGFEKDVSFPISLYWNTQAASYITRTRPKLNCFVTVSHFFSFAAPSLPGCVCVCVCAVNRSELVSWNNSLQVHY